MDSDTLRQALRKDRLSAYIRLRGGFPMPLAGAVYWAAIGILGYYLPLNIWLPMTLFCTFLIFPIAILLAKLFNNDFLKDKQAAGSVVIAALISMYSFWAMLVPALQTSPQLAILILAIGMAIHWPVIGWSYDRTALFSAHLIVRSAVVLAIWYILPEARMTLLPFSVSLIYILTVIAILRDVKRLERTQSV